MGIQTESDFWASIEGGAITTAGAGTLMQMAPVPSTIPSMSDVVRTNTEVKVNLDAAQV